MSYCMSDTDSLESLYDRMAEKHLRKAQDAPERPSAAVRHVPAPFKRLAPAQKTHCLRGHERTDANLDGGGSCRLCRSV